MKTNYQALDISYFFIQKGVSPLKLQKLLYYSQLWFFVKNEKKLFNDKIQAWIYGPVVYDVWAHFKFMRRSAIIPKNRAKDNTGVVLDGSTLKHLADVWNAYGHLSGSDLIDLTHDELPWKNSRKGMLSDEPSGKEVLINNQTTFEFLLNVDNTIPFVPSQNTLGHYSNF